MEKGARKDAVFPVAYLWLVGNGRMVVMVDRIVPHSFIPY